MLTIGQIIAEADLLVNNSVAPVDKVLQLNAINQDFFNVVKIPQIVRFSAISGQSEYTLPATVREKNIDLVEVGMLKYKNLLRDDVTPTDNVFNFDDATSKLNLSPAPYQGGIQGLVRYHRIATTTFTTDNLSAVPDAPEEYQWTYIPALAAFLAGTWDDGVKAANFENQYKSAWNVAAQNYQKG